MITENYCLNLSSLVKYAFRLTGKPEREVQGEYPLETIREAVTNVLCHVIIPV